jgi:NADPH2:quinone reductase
VGSEDKARLAKERGCKHTILYAKEDVAKRVREITNGEGVPVVYDSVGKATLAGSLDSLRPRGMMVSFGNSSGPIAALDPAELQKRGSLYFTRPTLMTYTAKRDDLLASAKALFDVVSSGHVKITINQTYALKDTAQAHRDLEGRKTTGSTVLLP